MNDLTPDVKADPAESLTFIIAAEGTKAANDLEEATLGVPVEVLRIAPKDLWLHTGLDAIHVSIPLAERWGAKPLLYCLQFFHTTSRERDQGYPPVVIAGYAKDPADRRVGRELLGPVLDLLFDELDEYNRSGAEPVRRIGIMARHLLIEDLGGTVVGQMLTEKFEARASGRPGSSPQR